MKLAALFTESDLVTSVSQDALEIEVRGVNFDSRKVQPGDVFFAFKGEKLDGTAFAGKAMAAGAVAVASEAPRPPGFAGTWLQVRDARKTLASVSGELLGHPDHDLKIIGITGTNGKTTTAYLVDGILRHAGKLTALIGTIEYRLANKVMPSINTTPESLDLLRIFNDLRALDGTHVTMEVSSHALQLGRVHGIEFDTAVFTNLTRDHLDFHQTMDQYFAAKQLLFSGTATTAPRYAVINQDDPSGRSIKRKPATETIWYGLQEGATARAVRIANTFDGLKFDLEFHEQVYSIRSQMVGEINVYNILAAWCVAFTQGIDPQTIVDGIQHCPPVPGRFERVQEGQPFLVIVDYAHTDDALRNAITAARSLTQKRVITLFGCGGDRDRSKRPLMGMAAAEGSDLVVLTSDNPRSEDPLSIMNDALVGIRRYDTALIVEPDRAKAIRKAVEEAGPGDVLLIAGKGHETYQVLSDRTVEFDDRSVARAVLKGFGYGRSPGDSV
jgi:UDP-N-acetylmuramoyl-L-alanyl-D-glutamate--2,6-diaminopimelate ligase